MAIYRSSGDLLEFQQLDVWQSLAATVLMSAAEYKSPASFYAHNNRVILTYLFTYLLFVLHLTG